MSITVLTVTAVSVRASVHQPDGSAAAYAHEVDRLGTPPVDRLGRPVRDLRISVTDRCNLRCTYCMPRDVFGPDQAFMPREEILSFEEIRRLVEVFACLGVTKVRLTGGEPLLRRDLEKLVGRG